MQDLKYQVEVDAEANFIEGQSNPAEGRFVFTYTVKIANNGTLPHNYYIVTGKLRMAKEEFARCMAMGL